MLQLSFYAILHAISQMMQRYVYPRLPVHLSQPSFHLNLHELSLNDWISLVPAATRWCGTLGMMNLPGDRTIAEVVYQHMQEIWGNGIKYSVFSDPDFPKLLREIPDPPLAISQVGQIRDAGGLRVAVVGSRKASRRAQRECFEFGRLSVRQNVTVISGGAIGCDIWAHQGLIEGCVGRVSAPAGGVVVFAGGLHRLNPRCNNRIFEELRALGVAFTSEQLWGQQALPHFFPARNRIISGLADLVLIMQAGEASGASITARTALDQGREVAVLTHHADDVRATGSHRLLTDGARSFSSAEEILGQIYPTTLIGRIVYEAL